MVAQATSTMHKQPILTEEHISNLGDVLLERRGGRHQLERRTGLDWIGHRPVALPDPLLGILKVVRVEKRIARQS